MSLTTLDQITATAPAASQGEARVETHGFRLPYDRIAALALAATLLVGVVELLPGILGSHVSAEEAWARPSCAAAEDLNTSEFASEKTAQLVAACAQYGGVLPEPVAAEILDTK